jgi:hypothetical protein
MLAQKIALETDERGAMAVANKIFRVNRPTKYASPVLNWSSILSRRMAERKTCG